MRVLIYKDGKFTGHAGHHKNMDDMAQVLSRKYPSSKIEIKMAKDQTASTFVTRF